MKVGYRVRIWKTSRNKLKSTWPMLDSLWTVVGPVLWLRQILSERSFCTTFVGVSASEDSLCKQRSRLLDSWVNRSCKSAYLSQDWLSIVIELIASEKKGWWMKSWWWRWRQLWWRWGWGWQYKDFFIFWARFFDCFPECKKLFGAFPATNRALDQAFWCSPLCKKVLLELYLMQKIAL